MADSTVNIIGISQITFKSGGLSFVNCTNDTLVLGISGGGSGALLQTNSISNTVQSVLNLIQGDGITLTAGSTGGVTAAWGPLTGDVTSSILATSVAKLQGTTLTVGTPTNAQVLSYSSASNSIIFQNISAIPNANASQLQSTSISSTAPLDAQDLQYVSAASQWQPTYIQPYRVQEAHADMSGNTPGMYTGNSAAFRWATNGANTTSAVNASGGNASEKLLFQMYTNSISGNTTLYGCNQSSHFPYTLGNTKWYRSRSGITSAANVRFWCGLSDWTNLVGTPANWNTDTPSQNIVGFRYSTNASDVNYKAYCSTSSSANTVVDTGVAANTAIHVFEFYYDGSKVNFFIDGNAVATINTHLPSASLGMDQVMTVSTLTTSPRGLTMDHVAIFW